MTISQHGGGRRDAEVHAESTPAGSWDVADLLARIRNDRYSLDEHPEDPRAKSWNACSLHVERLVLDWWGEQRVKEGLAELVDAPVLDLSLKHEMTGDIE